MRALTLRQPWCFAITHLGKRVENRTQRPPAALVGKRIAIHAAKGVHPEYEAAAVEWMHARGLWKPPSDGPCQGLGDLAQGAIVATARIARWFKLSPGHKPDPETLAPGAAPDEIQDSPWFTGPVGILLADVVVLEEPVPARGMQGWWPVPADVEARVMEQSR